MQDMIISDGIVFRPDGQFHKGDIFISGNRFVNSPAPDAKIISAENLFIIPGLTDIHFHGCMGHDFCEGTSEAFSTITNYQASQGITAICPATMTLPEHELTLIMKSARDFHDTCPSLVGIDLEGPFISPAKKGAQNPKYIAAPDSDMLARLQETSGGLIRIALIAPEVDGAMTFIERAKDIAVLSVGHTACDYETARRAFELGASHVTHLYNAINPINHRAPGPIIAAVEDASVMVELICDGIHVHPSVVRNTLRMFGSERVIFISDSMEAAGMPDGDYELGGQRVIKKGRRAVLEDGVTIAGSVTNLMECMKQAVLDMGVSLEEAVMCSAVNPVRSIGLDEFYGSIEPGKYANLAALDKELNTLWVMKEGMLL